MPRIRGDCVETTRRQKTVGTELDDEGDWVISNSISCTCRRMWKILCWQCQHMDALASTIYSRILYYVFCGGRKEVIRALYSVRGPKLSTYSLEGICITSTATDFTYKWSLHQNRQRVRGSRTFMSCDQAISTWNRRNDISCILTINEIAHIPYLSNLIPQIMRICDHNLIRGPMF